MDKDYILHILGEVQLWNMSTHEALEKILSNERKSVRKHEHTQVFCTACKSSNTIHMEHIYYKCLDCDNMFRAK
jgi:hypothetical protein